MSTISRQLDGARVELVVTLAESTITTADMIGLRVGDVITTDQDVNRPLDVAVEGVTKFRAKPGAIKGQKAIQVGQVLPAPNEGEG